MKLTAIVIAATGLLIAGSATAASNRVSDADFIRASRCKGLATGLTGVVDAKAIDAYLKSAGTSRDPNAMNRADAEFDKAKREARTGNKERATAELTGACSAYLADPANLAKR